MCFSASGHAVVSCNTITQSVSSSVWTADGRLEATSAGSKSRIHERLRKTGSHQRIHSLTHFTLSSLNFTCSLCPSVWQLECVFAHCPNKDFSFFFWHERMRHSTALSWCVLKGNSLKCYDWPRNENQNIWRTISYYSNLDSDTVAVLKKDLLSL